MPEFIPTPTKSFLELGGLTIHFYALIILVGVVVAIAIGRERFVARGGDSEHISDIALWTVPAGVIGGRMYHVITSPDAYFGSGGHPLNAFKIWEGGMGIWGAIALGLAVAKWRFTFASSSVSFWVAADSFAPALLIAQAIGRWGNWFNGELFGSPTTLPWGLSIPPANRPIGYETFATFHPTFLYESIWCALGAFLLIAIEKSSWWRSKCAWPGASFCLYLIIYTVGRTWIEFLRIDDAHHILGLRLNIWVSVICFTGALTFLLRKIARISP